MGSKFDNVSYGYSAFSRNQFGIVIPCLSKLHKEIDKLSKKDLVWQTVSFGVLYKNIKKGVGRATRDEN